MTLSDISIRNPVFAWMLMIGLMLFGVIGFSGLGISQMPDVDFPTVSISVSLEGASPEIMESDVADIIEDAVSGIEGVEEIRSTCRQGRASIQVDLDINRDVDVALQEIQTKVLQAQRSLPKDIDPPVVSKSNPEDQPILMLSVSADRPLKDLMVYVRDTLKDEFQTIPGVGEVFLGGYVDRNLRIWLDSKKLSERSMTADDIIATVEREHIEVPAGRLELTQQELNVRVMGEAPTVEAFSRIPISARGGSPVHRVIRLKEVADIEDGLDDVRRLSRFNGIPAVGLGVKKQRGANAVETSKLVKKKMEELKPKLPQGFNIEVGFDSTKYIKESISELETTLILSALLTALVCWLFLGSFTSTINILLAIPTSILGTFLALYFFGFTLNTFTLLALSLSIGVVVDDAIMVLENIVRHRESGESRVEGALKGARQITFAATATTLSIVAIFLPVVFMKGIMGKFFFQFGATISVAVLLSLLEAITLTPMRCSQFLQISSRSEGSFFAKVNNVYTYLAERYGIVLKWALSHRWMVMAVATTVFIASFLTLIPLKKEMVPSQDRSVLMVHLKTPVGSSIEFTDDLLKKCEAYFKTRGEVVRYFSALGGFGGGEVNSAIMFVTLKEPGKRPVAEEKIALGRGPDAKTKVLKGRLSQNDLSSVVRRDLSKISKDLTVAVQDPSHSGFTRGGHNFPVEFKIQGSDWGKLSSLSEEIKNRLTASGKVVDADTDYEAGQPELQIVPNRDAATLRGVSISAIGNTIGALMAGRRAGKFTEGGHRFDVRVRLKRDQRLSAKDVENLYVRNNRGELVRLSEVVTLKEKTSLQFIRRINRVRAISIYGNPAPNMDQDTAMKEATKIVKELLPDGYRMEISGAAASTKESFQSLLFALLLGIIVAYMILGSQFNSFVHPVTVLLALPFSFSGAMLALLVCGMLGVSGASLNMYSIIGLILLMGLVKKNSILLVDFTNQMRASSAKVGVQEALLRACPIRLRPILMTSIATIAAATPVALAWGTGAEVLRPMAIAVIGGMIFSTLLTLVVVPCAYSLLSHLEHGKTHAVVIEDNAMKGLDESNGGANNFPKG
jgi:hydrophobe/amphiphile efflux-1 (HAE1) family protein